MLALLWVSPSQADVATEKCFTAETQEFQCWGEISEEACAAIRKSIPAALVELKESFQKKYLQVWEEHLEKKRTEPHMYNPLIGPNCYAYALSYSLEKLRENPEFINYDAFQVEVNRHYREIKPAAGESPAPGDLVVLYWTYTSIEMGEDSSGRPIKVRTPPRTIPIHAAIYLGDEIVVQKNNKDDACFSVGKLSRVATTYVGQEARGTRITEGSHYRYFRNSDR